MHRVAVIGATGYAGALAAAIVQAHPSLELTAITARSEIGTSHFELYARYRVPLSFEQFDADAIAERADAALVAYPHGAAAPTVRALRERRDVDHAQKRIADRLHVEQCSLLCLERALDRV